MNKFRKIMAKTGVGLLVLFLVFIIVGFIYENTGQDIATTVAYLVFIGVLVWGAWGAIELWI